MDKINGIFFDLDDTLLAKDKELSKKTIKYIQKIKKTKAIGIATGRPTYMIKKQIQEIEPNFPIISMNGAWISDKKGNIENPLYIKYINQKDTIAILNKLKELKINFLAYSKDTMFYWDPNKTSPWCKRIIKTWYSYDKKMRWPLNNIDNHDISKIKIIKFLTLVGEGKVKQKQKLVEFLNPIKSIQNIASGTKVIDIMKSGTSKGNALKFLANKKYLNLDELIVFGDAPNDLSMFNVVSYSVAMKNSFDEVKKAAKYVTKFTNNEDGVIRWMEKNL